MLVIVDCALTIVCAPAIDANAEVARTPAVARTSALRKFRLLMYCSLVGRDSPPLELQSRKPLAFLNHRSVGSRRPSTPEESAVRLEGGPESEDTLKTNCYEGKRMRAVFVTIPQHLLRNRHETATREDYRLVRATRGRPLHRNRPSAGLNRN